MSNGKFQAGNPGRPVGAKNKSTRKADEAFELVFDALQDDDTTKLEAWARDNLSDFYKLFAKKLTTTADNTSRVLTETVSEEQARQMAEAYIESSKRRDAPVGEGESHRLHAEIPPGLPGSEPTS